MQGSCDEATDDRRKVFLNQSVGQLLWIFQKIGDPFEEPRVQNGFGKEIPHEAEPF